MPPFATPKLKVERAERHLQELASSVQEFLATKPCAIVVEEFEGLPPHMEFHAWNARIGRTVPAELSAIIGDVVHNLRTALDLLACDLVRLGGKSTEGVYFPFCSAAWELPGMIKRRNIHRAGPDIVALLSGLKPYKGGNVALRAVHDMDIADKHKALIPVIAGVSIPEFSMRMGLRDNLIPSFETMVAFDGQMVVAVPTLSNLPLGSEIACNLLLVFDKGEVFAGHEIVETLKQLTELTAGIINTFEAHCEGRALKPE